MPRPSIRPLLIALTFLDAYGGSDEPTSSAGAGTIAPAATGSAVASTTPPNAPPNTPVTTAATTIPPTTTRWASVR